MSALPAHPWRQLVRLVRRAAGALSMAWLALAASAGVAGTPPSVAPEIATETAPDPEPGSMMAVRLAPHERIVLDGTLDHPAWQRAPAWSQFVEKFPRTGDAPPQATRVQLLFDERALYVGITVLDSEPALIRDDLVRFDGVNRTQDFVVVYIDAIGGRRSAQFFRVNAAGSMADGLHTAADDSEDFAPDFDWDAATHRSAAGWTAVLRLPFASLRFAEGRQDWRIMVARRLPREQFHLVTSVLVPRDAPSFIHRLQPLQGVALPEEHRFLTLRPSLTASRRRDDGQAGRSELQASLDVKWRPRAELVLDGTLNPDFSQVALDVPQLAGNTRFALSFPEKRPFFFESADLLRSPTEAFYTRSFTAPRWGLRGTWRGTVWSGSSLVVDDRGGGLVLLPGPYGTDAVAQPASRTLAARVKHDGGALQLGGLLAARRYAGGQGSNTVAGPDLAWALDDGWRLRAQWLQSHSDAFTGAAASQGHQVHATLARLSDDQELTLTLDDSSAGFRHDTGFVNQAGVHRASVFASHGWRALGPFNDFHLNLLAESVTERRGGGTVQQQLRPGLWATGAANLEWWLELHLQDRLRTARGGPLLQQRYLSSGLVLTPARWFALLDTQIAVGRLADTAADAVRPGLRWQGSAKLRPLARLELEPSLSLAWLRHDGQAVYRESAAQWLAVWHLNAQHSLRALLQSSRFERREQGQRDAGRVLALTYAWQHSAGTRLYLGLTRQRLGVDAPTRGTEAFVKLQLDADELATAWAAPRR